MSGKEKKIKEAIETKIKEIGTESVISQLLVPSQKDIQLRRGKKVSVDKILFPGYMFVECENISDVEANVKHINGVTSVLKQPLTSIEIERILGKVNKKEDKTTLHLNDKIKIIDGPFNSFVGTIDKLDIEKQKVKVSVMIFGRETMLDLLVSQIIKHGE
jgi:transcriptional antiterminator NusG